MASCAPEITPSERSGSFSKQKTSFASISGSMFGSWYGQILRMALRVDVERPQRSLTSNVGSSDTVIAQPGARHDTYGWSIHVPARSSLVGIEDSDFFRSVLERAARPSDGRRWRTTYSIPLDSQKRRLSPLEPSSLTTNMSGLSSSTVGTKSMTPWPLLMNASFT